MVAKYQYFIPVKYNRPFVHFLIWFCYYTFFIWVISLTKSKIVVSLGRVMKRTTNVSIIFLIWNRHGHECSLIWKLSGNFIKKCRDFLGRDILGTTFFRAESSLIQSSCRSFIRVIVPYEIFKVNFRVETKFLVSMSEEI
jgi:hypothetical protein